MVGIIRSARRPLGWQAPGPQPAGDQGCVDLLPEDDEDLSYLTGDWRIFQKLRGHRWSLDDLMTAHTAALHAQSVGATSALDLGCGLGSVLLMLAWRLPPLTVTGIEAQMDRAAMGRRSIAWNGASHRCQILDGDLRNESVLPSSVRFSLISGTPPYFPMGSGSLSEKTHAAACRFESRGGIEAYIAAADRWLASKGRFVVCTSALEVDRLKSAVNANSLHVIEHVEVIPKEGKAPLVMIDVCSRIAETKIERSITVRDRSDQWTAAFQDVRREMGMPVTPPNRASSFAL